MNICAVDQKTEQESLPDKALLNDLQDEVKTSASEYKLKTDTPTFECFPVRILLYLTNPILIPLSYVDL